MPTSSSLSNCYIPLPYIDDKDDSSAHILSLNYKRSSGDGGETPRSDKALRRLVLQRSILSSSSGSSSVEMGHTKVLCAVHGPRQQSTLDPSGSSSSSNNNSNGLICQVRYAPMFGIRPTTQVLQQPTSLDSLGRTSGSPTVSDLEIELSARVLDAISPAIPLFIFTSSKCVIDIFCMIVQDDGSALAACITAASLALADGGIEMYDLVSCCSTAIMMKPLTTTSSSTTNTINKTVLFLDPSEDEIQKSQGVVTVALMKNWKEINLWNQVGRLTPDVATEALDLCKDGCVTMHKFMRQALVGLK